MIQLLIKLVLTDAVSCCLKKFKEGGVENALGGRPGRGRNPEITDDEKAWIINSQKPVDFGYSAEVWTRALLTKHIHQFAEEAGHIRLSTISQLKGPYHTGRSRY